MMRWLGSTTSSRTSSYHSGVAGWAMSRSSRWSPSVRPPGHFKSRRTWPSPLAATGLEHAASSWHGRQLTRDQIAIFVVGNRPDETLGVDDPFVTRPLIPERAIRSSHAFGDGRDEPIGGVKLLRRATRAQRERECER